MLKTRYLKVNLRPLGENRYFLTADKNDDSGLPVSNWKNLLFFRHEESFYGTMVAVDTIDGVEGVVLNGWELVTLFAKEPFNRFIDWDWDEISEICLAAAPALYEAICERDWIPDFAVWEHDVFRWALPERVKDEFGPAFWEQRVKVAESAAAGGPEMDDNWKMAVTSHGDLDLEDGRIAQGSESDLEDGWIVQGSESDLEDGRIVQGTGSDLEDGWMAQGSESDLEDRWMAQGSESDLEDRWMAQGSESDLEDGWMIPGITNAVKVPGTEPVLRFIERWFDGALDAFLNANSEMKAMFGEKLEFLRNLGVSSGALAHFFNEESFKRWIGLQEDPAPFTVGLQLEEPIEAEDPWSLRVFLRSKADENVMYGVDEAPRGWQEFLSKVEADEARWCALFPWLADYEGKTTWNVGSISAGDNGVAAEMVPTLRIRGNLSEHEAWEFLTEASETLIGLGVEILLPGWWQAMKNASLKVKARVKSGSTRGPSFVGLQQMLDYDWRFSMNGVDLSEEEFQQLVEEKRRLVFVKGRWIKLDPQFIRQIQDLMKKAEKQGLHVRDLLEQELLGDESSAEADELENPKAFAKIQIEMNRQWKTMMSQLSDGKAIPEVAVPESFRGELRPYQKFGMSWMLFLRRCGFGACLADDMGLGKTVQLLSYLLWARENEADAGPALIVCPTSVLGNWQKEIERFAPGLKVYLHYGSGRLKGDEFRAAVADADIVLTSYGLTHMDLEEFESVVWSAVAIDEAQNIKNATTKQSRAVRKLRGRHHIALTGTPMENRLSELWSIFDFTNHGYLGSLGQFQKRFVAPIEKDGKKEKIERLQALIRPFLLRRTKKDPDVELNLPDKLEQKEYCPLTAEQASLYEQLIRDTFAQIESLSGFERKGLILGMLGKLKQLCNHPALYLKEANPRAVLERSAKMEKLVELVGALHEAGESCLIFTQYIEMGEMIRRLLERKFGLDVPFLNGSVPKQQRDVMIGRFQEREFPVFLLSLKAGGTGLNLTAANHVIHYDRWWNPAVENQATDRAYRIGQKRFVHVHKLISTGTLEEKIDAMLEKKQSLNEQIIQSENWITELGDQELEELLRLG